MFYVVDETDKATLWPISRCPYEIESATNCRTGVTCRTDWVVVIVPCIKDINDYLALLDKMMAFIVV